MNKTQQIRMKIILLLLMMILLQNTHSQPCELKPLQKGKKYGYADRNGKLW